MNSLHGVWTGRAARALSVGFLGVSEETLQAECLGIAKSASSVKDAFLYRVARHLGQQAGALQRARDAVK